MSRRFTEFPSSPIVQALGSDLWILRQDHVNRMTGRAIKLGFVFDGASIPRALWRVAGHPMQGDVLASALEHDADYSAQLIPREEADRRFLFNMRTAGVGAVRRTLFYWAVRLFGGSAWEYNRATVGRERRFVMEEEQWKKLNGRRTHQRKGSTTRCGKRCGNSGRK